MVENLPQINQILPDFSAPMTSGKTFQLSDYKGKNLILYFYPKDNTPGCTSEGIRFRELYPQLQRAGAEVVGVSRDSLRSHESLKATLAMPFELVSDPEEQVCRTFDVMKMKTMYGRQARGIERSTFVIDGSGRLVKEWRGVKVPDHVDEVLEYVKAIA